MGLFDRMGAVRGTMRVWLLWPIFIWGVRKAKVQIPIHWLGDISKHLSNKPRKGLDRGAPYCVCGKMSGLLTFYSLITFVPGYIAYNLRSSMICKSSGAFWVNSIAFKISPCKDGSIRVPMAVAIFHGTGVAKYRGAPKDEQSQQSLAIWGLCH